MWLLFVFVLVSVGCQAATPAANADLQRQADLYAIDQIEVTWHQAASTQDVELMMSIWADNATATLGGVTITGKDALRNFFATKAAPFQPQNHWVSDTPAYKIRTTVDGDTGTLYFECHYVDPTTKMVMSVVAADQKVARINGKWLITDLVSSSPVLTP